jgi:hypothetical protein
VDLAGRVRTSNFVPRFVNATRSLSVLTFALALASITSGVPATVHADDPIIPASNSSPDAPVSNANAGPKNIVVLQNTTSNTVMVRGHVQLGRVPSDLAGPVNLALSENVCPTACDTLAVALQVNLVDRDVNIFTPQNAAVAVNAGCNGCHAVAVALQYNILVDDPTQVPPDVNQFMAAMRQEMAWDSSTAMTLAQAETHMEGVIAQFQGLAGFLITSRDEKFTPATSIAPATTAQPASTAAPTTAPATAAPSPAPTPAPSPSPVSQPVASPTPNSTPPASASPP